MFYTIFSLLSKVIFLYYPILSLSFVHFMSISRLFSNYFVFNFFHTYTFRAILKLFFFCKMIGIILDEKLFENTHNDHTNDGNLGIALPPVFHISPLCYTAIEA